MNDLLASECSSGCESGWTSYLENSFISLHPSQRINEKGVCIEEKRTRYEDESDLSMVSDASSGPPHFHEEDEEYAKNDNGCFSNPPIEATLSKNIGKKKKNKETRRQNVQEQHCSYLDDTASSPVFNFSNNNGTLTDNQASMENLLDFSQGYSTTHFQERSAFQGQFDFFNSSVSGNQQQQNHWFEGKRWGMR